MTRKPWMPDPTLSAWVSFLGKAVPLSLAALAGVLIIGNGVQGFKDMRVEVTEVTAKVDTLATEMGGFGVKLDQLLHNDSTLAATLTVFQKQNDCMFQKMINGEEIGRYDCVQTETNGGETQ